MEKYISFENDSNQRNFACWRPVIILILNSIAELKDDQFKSHGSKFYVPAINLLAHEMPQDLRNSISLFFRKIGSFYEIK